MEAHKENLGLDIFVHDMDRFDQYPNFQETWFQKIKSKLFGPRIGPWFRCGLVGVGSQEVLLLLRWEGVKSAPNGEGLLHTSNSRIKGEPRTVGLIGFVPLEEIHEISWTGDDYYGHPHLYCYFHNAKGMPYSRISYCAKRDRPGLWAYYEELEDFYSVEKRTNWYKPYIDGAF